MLNYKTGDFSGSVKDSDSSKKEKDRERSSSKSSGQIPVNLNITNYKSDKYDNFKYKKSKDDDHNRSERKRDEKSNHKKKTNNQPSPYNFQDLLKLAHQKSKEPIETFKPEPKVEKEKKKDEGRPLTAKERQELEEEKQRKMRRMWNLPDKKDSSGGDKSKSDKSSGLGKIPKKDGQVKDKMIGGPSKLEKALKAERPDKSEQQTNSKIQEKNGKKPNLPEKSKKTDMAPPPRLAERSKYFAAYKPQNSNNNKPNSDIKKPVTPTESKVKSRSVPPPEAKKSSKISKRPPPLNPYMEAPHQRRPRIDSDSEYDSDMDDFIDDGDCGGSDVSSVIKSMFGYDKSKYKDEDDDLDDMESSFNQMQREEKVSAKIGLMEDLEDMKMEEEAKKRKMIKKKMIAKQRR